ncbi:PREDICTED: EG45-like domain containing protein [Populus euphratica]|uniref:EG45-like domain containing protein n=1 Tax=Populus euphratica TaxID=75702 RepID=A0AAJ6XN80_POPEU|nr:PREDICTED: EG45-like domain containing protein [Populus euphratica]
MASVFKNFIASSVMTLLCFSLYFYPFALAQDSGTATFYTPPYVPSKCYGYEDQGVMIAAASEGIFNNGEACGRYYQVTCVSGTNEGIPFPCLDNGSVVVMITDLCPPDSCRGTIDLSKEAFASIADPNSGVINISYQQI